MAEDGRGRGGKEKDISGGRDEGVPDNQLENKDPKIGLFQSCLWLFFHLQCKGSQSEMFTEPKESPGLIFSFRPAEVTLEPQRSV